MTHITPPAIYLVDEGPLFDRMIEWAQLRLEFGQSLRDLAEEFGADPKRVVWCEFSGCALGFKFDDNKQPKRWLQPDRRGRSLPYKNNKTAWEKIHAVAPPPQQFDFLEGIISRPRTVAACNDFCFFYFRSQGPFRMDLPGLTPVLAQLPHRDDATLTDPERNWLSPERLGARRILPEEWRVLKAQHDLSLARREQAELAEQELQP